MSKLALPNSVGEPQKAPELRRWRVHDCTGKIHEFDACGFTPTGHRTDFFIVDKPGSVIIHTNIKMKVIRIFFNAACIEVPE